MLSGRIASMIGLSARACTKLSHMRCTCAPLRLSRWTQTYSISAFGRGGATNIGEVRNMSTDLGQKKLGPDDFESLDEYLLSIDTTVPENKRAHVEKLKSRLEEVT